MPQTQTVSAPAGSIPMWSIAFGTLGAPANAVDRGTGLPVESAEAGIATTTIAAAAALGAAVDLDRQRLHRIMLPGDWTAAALSFQASADGQTYADLYDGSGEVVIAAGIAAAGRAIVVDPAIFYGIRFLKVRSGTAAAAVAQGGARSLTLATVAR